MGGLKISKIREFWKARLEKVKLGKFHLSKFRLKKFKVTTWTLLIILAVMLFLDATLLRFNHIKMTELRDAVMSADESEDDEALIKSLDELKEYVFTHIVVNVVDENGKQKVMFGTGPFYLEHQYLRAANQALAEAEEKMGDGSNPNGNIYQAASEVCRPQAIAGGWSWNSPDYINCMMGEIEKYPSSEDLQAQLMAELPSTELYRKNYASPLWAPTFTGWMILLTLVVIVVIFIRIIILVVLRLALFFV